MAAALDFPLAAGVLEAYRIATRKRLPAAQVGGHRRLRQGQSLEFHEHRKYLPGDDVRHIDWRASARLGAAAEPLVRCFAAEERLTIALSIDTRASMQLPGSMRKLDVALWLARAVASVALAGGDRVLLHPLFGEGELEELRGKKMSPRGLERLAALAQQPAAPQFNGLRLHRRLPPTSVWIVISDFYFDDADSQWRTLLQRAQEGARWVILVELDSWPAERALLLGGAAEVDGPGLEQPLRRQLDDSQAATVEARIRSHTAGLWQDVRRGGLDHVLWSWPEPPVTDGGGTCFTGWFLHEPVLQRLFGKRG